MTDARSARVLTELTEHERNDAWSRWLVIAPSVEDDVPLTHAAKSAGLPISTARRWLARYRADGLVGLARVPRSDRGQRRIEPGLVALIEALAVRTPRLSAATIARRVQQSGSEHGWPAPSYSTVAQIVAAIDPALMTLAHEGPGAFRDRFELVHRRAAQRPNDIWQADHTELDILVCDADGTPLRPWLTLILDDYSRAVAGYTVFLGAPSALNLSLALRQAIWRKTDPEWPVHGIPDALHVDHGSDFTSNHIEQVCVDLHVGLIYSGIARPQGRGKVERLFGTITSELLPDLPGRLVVGAPATPPRLTLHELDKAIGRWILNTYHQRVHQETRGTPHERWIAGGWLPRMPNSLEALDLLLVMVALPRVVHRDGIRFEGLRYIDPMLADYVGRSVTIRYDPRDITEIRVFLNDRFLCRAINPEHASETITLKDIQTARTKHRRALRAQISAANAAISEYLPRNAPERPVATQNPTTPRPTTAVKRNDLPNRAPLYVYLEDKESDEHHRSAR